MSEKTKDAIEALDWKLEVREIGRVERVRRLSVPTPERGNEENCPISNS